MTTVTWNKAEAKDSVTKRFGWNVYELSDSKADQYQTIIHELRLGSIEHSYEGRDYIGSFNTFDIRWQSTTDTQYKDSLAGKVFGGRIDNGSLDSAVQFGKLMAQVQSVQSRLSLRSPDERANFITALRSLGFVQVTRDRSEGHSLGEIASYQ